MQQVTRITLTLLFALTLGCTAWAKTDAKEAEYKRSDADYYLKADVLKADPTAVIIAQGNYTQKGDSYFIVPKIKAPKEIYIQVLKDWVEPITPPDEPLSLGVAPDAMQIREPQGDVQVAYPSAPATFLPATNGLTIPNGSIIKTGANGTAAILFGGVDSARLIPNSQISVEQSVTADFRTTKLDLTSGAVFSKVGQRIGEKQDYTVHTPYGVAAARGTDFVTVALPTRTDVWVAQGTVQLTQPDGTVVGTVKSEGTGALKIIRFPVSPDANQALMASAQTMTTAFDFIPTVNLKLKALRDKVAAGTPLTDREQDYLKRIKEIPCLIKLALVETPPPAPVVVPPPAAPTPPPAPIDLDLRTDGKVDFQGATLTLAELKQKLADLAKTTPDQPIVVKPADKSESKTVKKIEALCHEAKFKNVTVDNSIAEKAAADKAAADKAAADKAAADKAAAAKAAADKAAADKAAADKAAADKAAAKKAAADKVAAEAKLPPIHLAVHADGKVDYQGASLSLDDLKPKLTDLANATPGQPVIVEKAEPLEKGSLHKVADLCKACKLTSVTISKAPAPTPPPAPAPTPTAPAVAAAPVNLTPIDIEVRADGKVDYQGATLTLDDLKSKLADLAKATPDQPVVVKRKEHLEKGQFRKAVDVVKASKLTKIKIDKTEPPAAAAPVVPPAPLPAAPAAPSAPALPPAMELPLNLQLRPDGKVDFDSATLTLHELKPKLEEIAKATPQREIIILGKEKVSSHQVKRVVALCTEARLKATVSEPEVPPRLVATGSASLAPLPPPSTVASSGAVVSTSTNNAEALPQPSSAPARQTKSDLAPAAAVPISAGPNDTVP